MSALLGAAGAKLLWLRLGPMAGRARPAAPRPLSAATRRPTPTPLSLVSQLAVAA